MPLKDNIIQTRFKEILNSKGWTYSEFIKKNNLHEWEDSIDNVYYGRSKDPRASTLLIISKALGCGINCLMGSCSHTSEERAILKYYRECGAHGKGIIELVAKYEALSVKNERESLEKHKIPCIIPSTDIRKGLLYETCETIEVETEVKEAFLAIKMPNNDLSPAFCKDDYILFENRFPNNREVAAFFKGDRAYVRKYLEEDGQYRLKCLHHFGEDMIFKRMDQVDYIGTCCGVIRS